MAIIVTFSVTYSLIMPAITVSRDQADEIAGLYLDDSEEVFDIVEDGGDEDELWTSEDTVIQHAGAMEDDWDGILIEEETEDETEETGSGIELEEPAQSENLNAHYTYEQELSTDTEAETTAAIELDSEDEEETETESQIEISVETESDTEVETESETEIETESETESEAKIQTESETAIETETESETQYPAQRFTASEGGVLIIVNAPESAFPEGTTMTVSHVDDEQTLKGIEEAAQTDEKLISRIEAVDICFRDADGNEIEPKAPVSVCMITENKASKEDPVVVHVDDEGHAESVQDAEVYTTGTHDQIVLTANGSAANQAESETETISESSADADTNTAIEFETEQFSIYAVVYTVDFHYGADGKEYNFSLPGGGFVSLAHLVEVLEIASTDEKVENRADKAENGAENGNDFVGEVPGADKNGENGEGNSEEVFDACSSSSIISAAYAESINLNNVPVSEATKKLVTDIESVESSSPQLVWVGKVDNETTVSGLKEANGLEAEYSADLTEEQIAEINAQTVEAGDWALISMHPFTSEETLTVSMKNGDQFAVKVTDAQIKKTVIDAKGDTWEITVTYGEDAHIPAGAELKVEEILPETEAYYEYYRKAADLVCPAEEEWNRYGYGRLFDISILDGEVEIEPQSNVEVSIKLANTLEDKNELRVIHFGESEPEVMMLEKVLETSAISSSGDETNDSKETELRFETDAFSLYAVVSTNTSNGNGLDGKKFAIVNPNNARNEAVLGRSQENNTALSASEVTVQQIDGQRYLVGEEVTVWEFENVNNNVYYIKVPNGQYMHVANGTAFLSDTPQSITVSQSGNGLRLSNNGYGLNAWNRDVSQGFRAGTYNDDASRFTLYGVNELIQNQAEKISLTELVNLHEGETPIQEVVIYTRVLNQDRDGYDYYAVAADGSLVPVYDIGDTIGWVSSDDTPEHLKWKLTVHSTDGEENGYFDFQSMESDQYLIPTEATGLKTDDPDDSWDLGVNMQGWKADGSGTYGSAIERWDTRSREYVGYAYDAVNKKIVPTADDSQKLEFLFAHVEKEEDPSPNQLHTVETLDGKTKGITIKMYDFDGSNLYQASPPRSREMTNVLGVGSISSTNENGVGYANTGLVSQTLTNGFPIATQTTRSLSELFNNDHYESDASNIFVQQVYDETGYFSYDSSKNYAYLDQANNEFILYRELAAPEMEGDNTPSANKGNFFPFDSLQELADQNKVFTNRFAKYDGDLQEMSSDNPQYGQTLYKIAHGNTNN